MRFIDVVGLVQYETRGGMPELREKYGLSRCEIPGCGSTLPVEVDHCHEHGWVRGILCRSHNVSLGHLESVMRMPGVTVTVSRDSAWRSYRFNCPECRPPSQRSYRGTPCRRGHLYRYIANDMCVDCRRIYNARQKTKKPK